MTVNVVMYSEKQGRDEILPPSGSDTVPIVLITAQDDINDDGSDDEWFQILPLPSSKYRYTKWHEIENMPVASSMLRAPRVRRAPQCYRKDIIHAVEEQENSDSDFDLESGNQVPKTNRRKKRRKILSSRSKLENWQSCDCVNLSYQDLGHGFQCKEFIKVLRRLVRCTEIKLIENSLTDMHTICFPNCTTLYLQRNFLTSFKKLPRLPSIEVLLLQQNNIQSLEGLEIFKRSKLKSLTLDGNPISLQKDYRKRVFHMLPMLKLLDGLPKLPSDEYLEAENSEPRKCAIS